MQTDVLFETAVAALLLSFWKERYGLPLVFNLSTLPPGRAGTLTNMISLISPSAKPRSVSAVFRALNKLIPYLWAVGTIYPRCNVIRGQGGEQGPSRCSLLISSPDTVPFPITRTPSQSPRWLRCSYRKWENGLFFAAYQNRSRISISCKSLQLLCTALIHLRQPGSPQGMWIWGRSVAASECKSFTYTQTPSSCGFVAKHRLLQFHIWRCKH